MPKKVAVIEQVFWIEGLGTVVALPNEDQWLISPHERIRRREKIQIRTPFGICICTYIKNIEMINRGRDKCGIAFSLPSTIKLEDIPERSEIWLERDGTEPLLEP